MCAHLGPTDGRRVHAVVHRIEGWSTWEERHVTGVRREEDVKPCMARVLQVVPSALPGHCDLKSPAQATHQGAYPRQGRHGLGGEERCGGRHPPRQPAIRRSSAKGFRLEGSPSGMAAQVAVGKLMVGAKALLAARILSRRQVMPDWKNTAVRCLPVGHARRRPPCPRGGAAFLRMGLVRLVVAELERFFAGTCRR